MENNETEKVKKTFMIFNIGDPDNFTGRFRHQITSSDLIPSFDTILSIEEKVKKLLSQMSLVEKLTLIRGNSNMGIPSIPRLKLPEVWCTDATLGVCCNGRSTAFPAAVAMVASWNPTIMEKVGDIIAQECRARGISILLGPGVNIYRIPTNGRNFEYMGEDPYLASEMVVPYIKAVQNHGVITTVKHFVCDNSDYDKHRMDCIVDERTLHEIYFPTFKAAIQKGKSLGIMAAYNLLNGVHCSESKYLLTDILRDKWGFKGFVISDWNSMYDTEAPLKAGLDLEKPQGKYYTEEKIMRLINEGKVSEEDINVRVSSILFSFIKAGIYGRPIKDLKFEEFSQKHDQIALDIARESIVLLKNDSILPISSDSNKKIVLIGPNMNPTPTGGGGSSYVKPYKPKSLLTAFQELLPNKLKLIYFELELISLEFDFIQEKLDTEIRSADYIILALGFNPYYESECWDRIWKLPNEQLDLITKITNLNKNCIAIINAGGGFETESWIDKIPAVIHSFYLGQNPGIPIVEIILGQVNPSGKLPFTMARRWEDFESIKNYAENYYETDFEKFIQNTDPEYRFKSNPFEYKEGLQIGYRHFDYKKIIPQFAFGHGLSYTEFRYQNLVLGSTKIYGDDELLITLEIENIGNLPGKEIVQLYVQDVECSVFRPPKELKGFCKIDLEPKELKKISFILTKNDLAFYDVKNHNWKVEPGEFIIHLGSSSRDIRCSKKFSYYSL